MPGDATPTTKVPAVELYLEIGDKRYQIADYKEASDKVTAAVDSGIAQGLSSRDFLSPTIVDSNGKIIAHVSWNGRVWPGRPGRPGDPGDWTPGTKPLYDNRDTSQKAPELPGPSDSGPVRVQNAETVKGVPLPPVTRDDDGAAKWWRDELTAHGREMVTAVALPKNIAKRVAKTSWAHIAPGVQQSLAKVRGTDRDPAKIAEAPTWAEILAALPKDAQGRPDMKRAADVAQQISGQRRLDYKALTPSQKTEMLRRVKDAAKPDGLANPDRPITDNAPKSDLRAAFDDVLDEVFGVDEAKKPAPGPRAPRAPRDPAAPPRTAQPRAPRTKTQLAGSASKKAVEAADAAMDGLLEMFGGGKSVGMGLNFDEDTYRKAKPLFIQAAGKFTEAIEDARELLRRIVTDMKARKGFTRDAFEKMWPYLERFIQDVKDGVIRLGAALGGANIKGEESPDGKPGTSPEPRPEQADDVGEAGVGGAGGDVADGKPAGNQRPGKLGEPPAEDAGAAPGAGSGQGAGPRAGGEVPAGGEGVPEGGDAADGRAGAGGAGVASPGAGGRPEHASLRPNYFIADPERLIGGGPKARFARNRQAIEAFRAITDEARDPTPAELDAMAGYIGWGSFGQELFQGNWQRSNPKEGWEAEDKWLREHLGQAEWESAQSSIVNAHYTDPPTVTAMWGMLRAMGFNGGRVLEPSMGIGNFFGLMPRDLMASSDLTGIELDKLTGGMASILYPHGNVQIKGYQDSQTADNFYDVVIGNWPFAKEGPADRRHAKLNASLHDWFYVKALDQVRPGGIVMGITSAFTMDKLGKPVRLHLARNAELVAAFRLPTGAFKQYAGTEVVTDIIILKKREKPILDPSTEGWIEAKERTFGPGETLRVNEYYETHPDHVLGTLGYGRKTTYGHAGLAVTRGEDFPERLSKLADLVPKDAYQPIVRGNEPRFVANNTVDRQRSITLRDGKLYQVQGDRLVLLEDAVKYKTANAAETKKRESQVRHLVGLRKLYGSLLDAERDGEDSAETRRAELRHSYEKFRADHGSIVDSDGLAILKRAGDPNAAMLAALETVDGKPARVLAESTTRTKKKLDKPTVRDAFVLQRNQSTKLDLETVAELARQPLADVVKELTDTKAIYRTPGGGHEVSDVYLSGNVRRKLREALDAKENGEQGLDVSIEALRTVLPPDVPYYKIEAKLGAPWVPNEDYRAFIANLLGVKDDAGIEVAFRAARWKVRFENRALNHRPEAKTQWGHPDYPFDRLLGAAMGNVSITIRKRDDDGNKYVDEVATKEVNEKVTRLREEFSAWAWKDIARRVRFERAYNDVMRAIAEPKFDGSFLEFPGMALRRGNDPFSLRQHQVNAIWRGIVNRSGLYAHEVGTGKTYTMGGIAVESRRYGIARKPLLLAHNANSASVAAEIQEMYPGAKVLYVDNLTPQTIDVTMQRIAADDWDAIVVPHSVIDRFALSDKTLNAMMAEDIAALEQEAIEAATEDGSGLTVDMMDSGLTVDMMDNEKEMKKLRSPTAKQLVKQRNQIKEKIRKMAQRASREGAIKFEDLGVDMILVDEVHEFKKPPITTKMRMRGLNTGVSDRSIALRFLTDYVKSINNGRGVHIFTGTPITNTLTEIYNMQRYVMDDVMAKDGLKDWDAWFNVFANAETDVELTDTGEYEAVTRLAEFVNVADLRQMIGQYMDIVFAKDMPEFKPREVNGKTLASPDLTEAERAQLVDGRTENAIGRPYKKIVNDIGPMSAEQQSALNRLAGLAREFRDASKKQRRDWMLSGDERNPILVGINAAKAGLDIRLYDKEAPDHPQAKAHRVVKNIVKHYREHKLATQVIFVDQGFGDSAVQTQRTPGGEKVRVRVEKFNFVGSIVDELVAQGIPRDEIAIVDGGVSKARRKEIADKMNAAKIRVAIGNSDTLGVGVNMQRNLRAMHHLDAPWMPGELEQRNGRGERQGNQWNTVLEYRYITEKLDGRRWQVLAKKEHFIRRFLTADAETRVIGDDAVNAEEGETVSSLMQTLSEAAGDPRLLIKNKLQAKVTKLEQRERLHTFGIADAQDEIQRLKRAAGRREEYITALKQDVASLEVDRAGDRFYSFVGDAEFLKRKDAEDALTAAVLKLVKGERKSIIASVYGFKVEAEWLSFQSEPRYELLTTAGPLTVRPSIASIEAVLRNLSKRLADAQAEVADETESIKRMEAATKEPFAQAKQLEETRQQLRSIERDLANSPVAPPTWLRQGATIDTSIWLRDGKKLTERTVEGHRWTDTGWFVITKEGDVPYLEALDANGQRIYDPRPFEKPKLVEPATSASRGPTSAPAVPKDAKFSAVPQGWGSVDAMPPSRMSDAEIAKVREIVERVAGVDPHFAETIKIPVGSTGAIAWGKTEDGQAQGAYSPSTDLLAIALDVGNPRAGYHEAFHRVQTRFLDARERDILASETEKLRDMLRRDILRRPVDQMSQREIEAEAFAVYATDQDAGAKLNNILKRAWNRLRLMLNRLRNALNGMGYQTSEDIFGRAYSGAIADRAANPVNEKGEPLFALKADPGADGKPQLVIPGAEKITEKERAQRAADKPLKPKKAQKDTDGLPLFGDDSKQGTLFSLAPPTESEAFKRWFGKSKVVDERGRPMVVYHGTDAEEFDRFEYTNDIGFHFGGEGAANNRLEMTRSQADDITVEQQEGGEWAIVGPNKEPIGGTFATEAQAKKALGPVARNWEGVRIIPAYLSIQRPLRVKDLHDWNALDVLNELHRHRVLTDDELEYYVDGKGRANEVDLHLVSKLLAKHGYDGLEYKNETEGGISWVAFKPEQIKSATGNVGTFDPSDPRMMYSLAQEPQSAADRQRAMQGFLARGQLIDRAIRMPFDFFGGVTRDGQWRPGAKLYDGAAKIITGAKFSPESRWASLNPLLETARAGLVDRYGLDPAYVERDRRRALDERAVQMQGAEILRNLKDHAVGPAEARVLQAVLTGEDVTDADMRALAEPIRLAIDQLGQEAVALGMVSGESFERNRATYLHRVYKKHEADESGLVRMVNSIMSSRRKKIIGDQYRGRGMFQELAVGRLMRDVPEWHEAGRGRPQKGERFIRLDEMPAQAQLELDENRTPERPARTVYWPADRAIPDQYASFRNEGTWEVRGERAGKLVIWRDFTKAERERMGEILDARYTIAKTFMLMAHDLSVGKLYKDIAENEDWTSTQPPAGRTLDAAEWQAQWQRLWKRGEVEWVKVPDTDIPDSGGKKRWGALAGRYVREEIWRDLNEQQIMSQPHVWRRLLTEWKLNKTVRSPVVHMNNVMSNFFLMDLMDVRFQDLAAGVRAFATKDRHYQEAFENGAFGADMMSQEIRDQVLKPVLDEIMRSNTFQQGGHLGALGQVSRFTALLWSKLKAADKLMKDAYRVEDELFRMATYIRRRELGDTPKQAADNAREQFIDYDIRAPWVNVARNTVLPFISYTYRAVPLVARAIASRPWKLAKYFALAYAANALAYAATGGDEDKERKSLREQEQGHTWIGTERMTRMPWNDKHGNPIFLDVRRWVPAGDVFDMQGDLPAWLNIGGPLMIGAELLLNRSAFTGQEIVNSKTDDFWDRTSKRGDHLYKAAMPSAAWVPGSWYWERIGNAAVGATDRQGRPYSIGTAVASSFGIKLKPQDVDDAFAGKAIEFRRIERELQAEQRRLEDRRDRKIISEREYNRGSAAIEKKLERLGEKRDETFK